MARKRIRIGVEDVSKDTKYEIRVEGNVTRENILKIFEMMDLVNIEEPETPNLDSVGSKIWHIVDRHFPVGSFTSNQILEKYEDEYNEPIKLSVISTYLSRFTQKGRVQRTKSGREWTYQTIKLTQRQPDGY